MNKIFIIAIAGDNGVGKTTLANGIATILSKEDNDKFIIEKNKFADPVYNMVANVLGTSLKDVKSTDKENPKRFNTTHEEWVNKKIGTVTQNSFGVHFELSIRDMLISFAEGIKSVKGEDFFASIMHMHLNRFRNEIDEVRKEKDALCAGVFIIDDLRFPKEEEMLVNFTKYSGNIDNAEVNLIVTKLIEKPTRMINELNDIFTLTPITKTYCIANSEELSDSESTSLFWIMKTLLNI